MTHLNGTRVSDAGLEHLKGLTRLQELCLGGTKVSDAGLKHLKGLTQLKTLYLGQTAVGDTGLQYLKGLTQLKTLYLDQTKVSDAGVIDLQKALPNTYIARSPPRRTAFPRFLGAGVGQLDCVK